MPTKTLEKNIEYVAKHRSKLRASIGDEAYKKKEAEARQLRRLKAKAKADSNITNAKSLASRTGSNMIDNLFNNVLSSIPQKRRGRPRKNTPTNTNDLSVAERKRIYMRNYMRNYKKN